MKDNTKSNPRWKSGRRRKYQQRFRAMDLPCAICKGRLGPIDYTDTSAKNPLGFVIDERIPVSRWKQAGYESAAACADDFNNLQPAHRICNAMKGNKINYVFPKNQTVKKKKGIAQDGQW